MALFGAVSPLIALFGALLIVAVTLIVPQVVPSESEDRRESAVASPPSIRSLIEALSEPAILLSQRGAVLEFNNAAREALSNLRPDEPISFALRVPEVLDAVRGVGGGGPACVVEYADRVPVDRWTEAHVDPVRTIASADQAPDFVLLTLHDLTHLRRAERMRVDFVANASHELRTPLAALLGFIETLQGPAKNDVDARARFLEIMRGQAARMSRLVDDLLSLSRIEQKQHMRPVDQVDLVEIVKTVLDSLAPLATEREVTIVTSIPSEPLMAAGDRDELIRVVENLTENGIKYGQAGKRIEVAVFGTTIGNRQEAQFCVRDYGPGIAAEHLPRLTERFYRIDAGQSRDKGGTGLGLAIVKHIMARHRGRLLIESPEGGGARFTIALETSPARSNIKTMRRLGKMLAEG
ncbi:ATP-binding protein [Terrihabitans sp. B22-R8]|uniref:ATP-binding protein n=1 Tax=Terrihabitans sp. B22-R8 TaxID=3425128 RepID=UPI00403CAC89